MSAEARRLRDLFVEEARGVEIREAMDRLPLGHLKLASTSGEHVGPCPHCGGRDRLQVNPGKNAWLCRGAAEGKDAIGLAAHVLSLDVRRGDEFLEACSVVLGEAVPDGEAEGESAARERAERVAARKREAEAAARKRAGEANDFRLKEQAKARGKWQHGQAEGLHLTYLARRMNCYARELPALPFLRSIERETYWHGEDERGYAAELMVGPAMVAPFVAPSGEVIGCHLTWIDLGRRPKFRPLIPDPKAPRGDPLPTKKMRGTKKGGLIPLVGFYEFGGLILPEPDRHRFVSGEGIENTVAVALGEGPRADTIYAAAGDLGNLAGPAAKGSRVRHPDLKKADKNGVLRAVFFMGAAPKPDQSPDEAMQVPSWVREIDLLGDLDSEPHATAAAMARARLRLESDHSTAVVVWPTGAADFAELLSHFPFGH